MKTKSVSKSVRSTMSIPAYDAAQRATEASICRRLREEIERALPKATSKVWHGAPVWFVGDTPVVGYNVAAKGGVVLLFWNGRAFEDPALTPIGKFKAAQAHFGAASEIEPASLRGWLKQAGSQIWDTSALLRKRARALRSRKGDRT
jgi:hypothetical protein